MDSDDGANHSGDNDGVTEVRLDGVGLHARLETLLRLHALLDEVQVLGLVADTSTVSSATSAEQVVQLVLGQLQDLVQVDATVFELSEGSLFGSSRRVSHSLSDYLTLPRIKTASSFNENDVILRSLTWI